MKPDLADLVLGTGLRQRTRASQALLGLAVYAVFAGVQQLEVTLGMIDAVASNWLTSWTLGGGLGFFLLIRSGLNRHLGPDPGLTLPQMIWAVVAVTGAYAITGPARGAVLLIMVLVIVFGVFALTPAQSRLVGALGVAMLASVMVWKGATDPARYDPQVEAFHLVFMAVVIGFVSALAIRLGRLRARLVEQREQIASALQRIQTLATHDDLTGLLNRRAMADRLCDHLCTRRLAQAPVCLALIDLDHFKWINDNHGHAAGDRVLKIFAGVVRAALRDGDLVARWGGEEFLVLMPTANVDQALAALARVRELLRQQSFDDIEPGLRVSFSAGAALCTGEDDIDAAIARADDAMYRAKSEGRDRVRLAA